MTFNRLLLVSVLIAACGGSSPRGSKDSTDDASDRDVDVPTALESTAAGPAAPSGPVDADARIVLLIAEDGYRIGLGDYTYFLGRCEGDHDHAALADLLGRLKEPAGNGALTLSAVTGVAYEELVVTIDRAHQVGLVDIGVVRPDELDDALLGDPPARAANADCDGRAVGVTIPPARPAGHSPGAIAQGPTAPAKGPASAAPEKRLGGPIQLPARDEPLDLDATVVIVVSPDEILVDGRSVAPVQGAVSGDTVPALSAPLQQARADGVAVVILQADRTTDARILTAVLTTAKAAGLEKIMFAVKREN